MIPVKRVVFAAALSLAGIMLAALTVYLLVSDETLVAWIAKRAESAAGVSISYQAPAKLTRTLSPTLTVADLSVVDAETRYALNTTSLQLQISLPRLILGRLDIPRLWLGDTRIEVRTAATPGKQATGPAADQQRVLAPMPVLHDVRIAQLHVGSEGKELRLPTLDVDELALAFEATTDTLVLTARIDVADQLVDIEARVARANNPCYVIQPSLVLAPSLGRVSCSSSKTTKSSA